MDVRNLVGKCALVTGAASGIGKATALALAERGADLVLCDVNPGGLKETEALVAALGRKTMIGSVDVAQRDEMEAFAAEVHREVEALDILVNNAGVALIASFQETPLEDWERLVGINLWGVIHGLHFFVPQMVARGQGGHVVNISSIAGFLAPKSLNAYSTTKFAVYGLSEALRAELMPHSIGVTAVCPGAVNTSLIHTIPVRGMDAPAEARQQASELFRRRKRTPERVAEKILKAIQRNRAVLPISAESWLGYYTKRLTPGLLAWVLRKVNEHAEKHSAPV
jgi:NAD(P)-dependent dehydrogenase (short-subunit alcohol dehydrogenase family)